MVFIQRQVISSAVAQVDFVQGIGSDFDEYLLTLTNIIPVTNDVGLYARVSEDGGTTFKSGGSDYAGQSNVLQAGSNFPVAATAPQFQTNCTVPNVTTDSGANGEMRFFDPSSSAHVKNFTWHLHGQRAATGPIYAMGNGRYIGTNNAINAIRLFFSTGNIASGIIALYGVRRA